MAELYYTYSFKSIIFRFFFFFFLFFLKANPINLPFGEIVIPLKISSEKKDKIDLKNWLGKSVKKKIERFKNPDFKKASEKILIKKTKDLLKKNSKIQKKIEVKKSQSEAKKSLKNPKDKKDSLRFEKKIKGRKKTSSQLVNKIMKSENEFIY